MNIFKRRVPTLQDKNKKLRLTIIIAGIVSLAAYMSLFILSKDRPLPHIDEMTEAAQIMHKSISVIRDYCNKSGIKIDTTVDPNQTGLIGPEYTDITTTIGHLEAKRTTTNPNMAGLIVHILYQAGVARGDTIAVGSSASFPALLVATLSAAQAMDVHPVIIVSLGASSYGGTKRDFNILDMYKLLCREGIINVQPAAISMGGGNDIGQNFEPKTRKNLMEQIQSSGIPFIHEPDLQKNVAVRMKIYKEASSESRISAFINTGGSYANIGTSNISLMLKSGLNKKITLPAKEKRGVLFEMAAQDIPVIHLLYIKGLVAKYGLPWDPIPLPKPGEVKFINTNPSSNIHFWLITIIYFIILLALFYYYYGIIRSKKT